MEEIESDESGEKGGKECQAMIGDEQLDQVDTMKYLGARSVETLVWVEKWRRELGVHRNNWGNEPGNLEEERTE